VTTRERPEERVVGDFFWRCLDGPGGDACRLVALPNGWRLSGTAVFAASGRACQLQYEVQTDAAWRTTRATVRGFAGKRAVDLRIRASAKHRWSVNGEAQPDANGLVDLDLGFTPATNLIAIRRLALRVGQHAAAPAAYLAFPRLKLGSLAQTYHRRGRLEYDYEAPKFGYTGRLAVSPLGAVVRYPGLFELVGARRGDAA
jgi:uncharacterized protein